MKETELKLLLESSEGRERIEALIQYSTFLRQSDGYRSCKYAREARQLSKTMGELDLEVLALTCLAYAHFYASEFEESRKYVQELIQIGIKADKPNVLGTSYNIQARIAYKSENPGTAFELFLKALDHYLKKPEALNLMSCYNNLGMCQLHLDNVEESYNYYNLALEQAEKLNHPARETILMNIGNIQYQREEFDLAMESYKRAEKMFKKNNLLTNLGNVYYNIALTFHELGKTKEGLGYFNKSYRIQKKINDPKGISTICQTIGATLLDMGKIDESLPYITEALSIAEEHQLKWNIVKACESFSEYWKQKEDFREVSNYLMRMIELSEELNQELNREKLSEMEAKYKTEIYKLRSAELDKENKSMSEQLSRLNVSMDSLHEMHQKLKGEFQEAVSKINEQDDMLSTQSRMAIMGEMISLIGHQWRQPLNMIGVLVQSFQDAWEYNEITGEFIDKQVKVVMEQICYMSETITDFRDFFKTADISVFSIEEVVLKAIHFADYSLKRTQIKVFTEFSGDCRIAGNPNEIIQVLLNIINNAREALEADKISKPEIKIRVKEIKESIVMSIADNGKPVSAAIMEKLFEPYFTTKGTSGTGIGLYICKMIIENKYKGTLEAHKLKDGIEFVIKLPVAQNE